MRRNTGLADMSFEVSSTRPAQTWNSVKHGVIVLARVISFIHQIPSRAGARQPR